MRSSTTLFIFIGLVLVVLLYGTITSAVSARNPVVQVSHAFMQGIYNNDKKVVETCLDPATSRLTSTGDRVVSIRFNAIEPFSGSFTKRPERTWSYTDLKAAELDKAEPIMVKDVATVPMGELSMYLHKTGAGWKVFYIDKPKDKAE